MVTDSGSKEKDDWLGMLLCSDMTSSLSSVLAVQGASCLQKFLRCALAGVGRGVRGDAASQKLVRLKQDCYRLQGAKKQVITAGSYS